MGNIKCDEAYLEDFRRLMLQNFAAYDEKTDQYHSDTSKSFKTGFLASGVVSHYCKKNVNSAFDLVIAVADYFNVSIDSMIGRVKDDSDGKFKHISKVKFLPETKPQKQDQPAQSVSHEMSANDLLDFVAEIMNRSKKKC